MTSWSTSLDTGFGPFELDAQKLIFESFLSVFFPIY
jgi:hypothetical protein